MFTRRFRQRCRHRVGRVERQGLKGRRLLRLRLGTRRREDQFFHRFDCGFLRRCRRVFTAQLHDRRRVRRQIAQREENLTLSNHRVDEICIAYGQQLASNEEEMLVSPSN